MKLQVFIVYMEQHLVVVMMQCPTTMSSLISFDVELDLTQGVKKPYIKQNSSERKHHALDKPLWQFLDLLVPNFQRDSVPPFLKTVALRAHLSHENIRLLKCCQKRDKREVAPGIFYIASESSSNPKNINANIENNDHDIGRNENNASNTSNENNVNNVNDKSPRSRNFT